MKLTLSVSIFLLSCLASCSDGPQIRNAPPESRTISLLDRADEAYLKGDHATAAALYQDFLRAHPDDPDAARVCYFSGRSHLSMGKIREAAQDMDAALQRSVPEKVVSRPALIYEVGLWWMRAGEWERGRAALEKLVRDYPSSSEASSAQGKLAFAENKFYVQVGSFKDRARADRHVAELKAKGVTAHVKTAASSILVLTGGYSSWAEAGREAARLKGLNIDALAVP